MKMHPVQDRQVHGQAFTLLEVIIACAIFFMCAFAILSVVTQGLVAARRMQVKEPDISMALSTSGLVLSNALVEGTVSGDFEDMFPDMYRGFSWQADVQEVGSNGLFQVDITLFKDARNHRGSSEQRATMFLYAPFSPPGSVTKGRF